MWWEGWGEGENFKQISCGAPSYYPEFLTLSKIRSLTNGARQVPFLLFFLVYEFTLIDSELFIL